MEDVDILALKRYQNLRPAFRPKKAWLGQRQRHYHNLYLVLILLHFLPKLEVFAVSDVCGTP